jgi:hypothetical protein
MDSEDVRAQNETSSSYFSGREELMSALAWKCYHRALKGQIIAGKTSWEAEVLFFMETEQRLRLCNQNAEETGSYNYECLFDVEQLLRFKSEAQSCIDNSFDTSGNYESDNSLLREDKEWAKRLGLNFHPSVTINDFTFRGAITFEDLMDALCAAFHSRAAECRVTSVLESPIEEVIRAHHEKRRSDRS